MPPRSVVILFAIPAISGCTLIATFDDRPHRDGGSSGAGGAAGASGDCQSLHGPKMLRVGTFCIDSTEVTRGDYSKFLLDHGSTPQDLTTPCGFNADLTPEATTWASGSGDPGRPIRGIDICDAREFCTWAGKRLCGKRGDGGSVAPEFTASAEIDEWYFACSHNGERMFPYGETENPTACTTSDNLPSGDAVRVVGTQPDCEGGFQGLFDMSGNVWEWENSCSDTDPPVCRARGGSYKHNGEDVSCIGYYLTDPTDNADIGVRCCSD
jgi:formylglycine-generating enzyme required for sulfatase activity